MRSRRPRKAHTKMQAHPEHRPTAQPAQPEQGPETEVKDMRRTHQPTTEADNHAHIATASRNQFWSRRTLGKPP